MLSIAVTILVLVGLQLKHLAADYLLQPRWVLRGKGDLRQVGGYVHAGLHALGTLPVLIVAGLEFSFIALLCLGEFLIHYLIDYTKAALSGRSPAGPDAQAYWALHGADQFMHQLTYIGLTFAALVLAGPG